MKSSRLALAMAIAAAAGCGSDTTTGKQIVLHTRLAADPEIMGAFQTGTGWSITLDKAVLATGPLYYFDGEPAFVRRPGRSIFRRLASLFQEGVAHAEGATRAHPGHYIAGNAKGQMTMPYSADLLAGQVMLPDGNGITGLFRSARFSLSAPSAGPATGALGDKVAVTEGSATKDGKTVHFRLSATFADVSRSVKDGQVEGCEFKETQVDADGTVTVTIRPHKWFDLVDFGPVAPGTEAAPTEIAAGETAQLAFALGLVQLSAYYFEYTK